MTPQRRSPDRSGEVSRELLKMWSERNSSAFAQRFSSSAMTTKARRAPLTSPMSWMWTAHGGSSRSHKFITGEASIGANVIYSRERSSFVQSTPSRSPDGSCDQTPPTTLGIASEMQNAPLSEARVTAHFIRATAMRSL